MLQSIKYGLNAHGEASSEHEAKATNDGLEKFCLRDKLTKDQMLKNTQAAARYSSATPQGLKFLVINSKHSEWPF